MAERPECREKIRDNLDMSCIENEALKELLSTSFQLEDNSPLESRLLDAVQTEEAQQFLSHLMFADAAPELLYPVEWWLSIIRNRQNEKKLFALNSKIREAEQTGDLEQQFEIKKIKHEGRIKLEDDKKGVLEIPVFDKDELVNLETTFSGLIEVGLREIEKAKVSGDIKTIKRWEETIKSLKGGNTGRKKWEVPF
jgi:hypothetical protein